MSRYLFTLLVVAMFTGSANGAAVLFVDSDAGLHSSWQTLIESGGHTFTRYSGDYNPNTQAEKDDIQNNYDVVVMSGSNANYNSVRNNGTGWQSLTTPTLNLSNYLLSGNFYPDSWRWSTPSDGSIKSTNGVLDVLEPTSLLFNGVTLNPGSPYQTTPDIGSSDSFVPNTGLVAGIQVIATDSGASNEIAIALAPAGTTTPGATLGADHIFFGAAGGGSGKAVPFTTAEGEKVFLNAITVLSGEGGVPEPASLALFGIGGLMMLRRRKA